MGLRTGGAADRQGGEGGEGGYRKWSVWDRFPLGMHQEKTWQKDQGFLQKLMVQNKEKIVYFFSLINPKVPFLSMIFGKKNANSETRKMQKKMLFPKIISDTFNTNNTHAKEHMRWAGIVTLVLGLVCGITLQC